MCDQNNSSAANETDSNTEINDDNGQHEDNEEKEEETVILMRKLEALKNLLAQHKKEVEEWNPTLEFTSEYIGNGFINITITECNSSVGQFELKYCFYDKPYEIDEDQLPFETVKILPRKLNKNTLLVRIPQCINDYYFIFQFRGYAIMERGSSIKKWTPYSSMKAILIPFDAPEYKYKVDEVVHFQKPDSPFWSTGIIRTISQGIAEVLHPQRDDDDEIFKVPVNNLKFEERYRTKLIDLTDWMDLSKALFFSDREQNKQNIHLLFMAIHDTIESNIVKWIFTEPKENEIEERMSVIDLIYLGDIEQDIKCCSRFIALNVAKFLSEDSNNYADNVIDNGMSIGCGLCPIKSHYKISTKLRNIWQSKLSSYAAYGREIGPEKANFNYIHMLATGTGTMCDICLIGFHNMSYIYCCDSSLADGQHDICMPCMNRNVLQYKRLLNTLNDLYFIHELDHYCISQIVYCVVGLIR